MLLWLRVKHFLYSSRVLCFMKKWNWSVERSAKKSVGAVRRMNVWTRFEDKLVPVSVLALSRSGWCWSLFRASQSLLWWVEFCLWSLNMAYIACFTGAIIKWQSSVGYTLFDDNDASVDDMTKICISEFRIVHKCNKCFDNYVFSVGTPIHHWWTKRKHARILVDR